MKRFKLILIVMIISVFLVGCSGGNGTTTGGNSNNKLSQEDVIKAAGASFENLKSVSQESRIELIFDLIDNKNKQNIELDAEVIYDKNHNPESVLTKTTSIMGDEKSSFDFYKDPDTMLTNDGTGWMPYLESENYGTTYKPILDTFLGVAKDFKMVEDENSYKFTFEGKDGNIYRTVGGPYNFQYTGLTDNDIELDIFYIIDKKDMFLKEMEIKTRGTVDAENSVSISGATEFDDFNDIKKIEKPGKM